MLHGIPLDPGFYLRELWLYGVLLGGLLILGTAISNRRKNRKKKRTLKALPPPEE